MALSRQIIIENGIEKFGEKQLIVAIEELAELQKEICKDIRGKRNDEHIAEELADVLIMCETIRQYYKIKCADLETIIDSKLERIK